METNKPSEETMTYVKQRYK